MSDDLALQKMVRRLRDPLQGWGFVVPASGTYTPTYLGGTTPGATTYALQSARWVRIGNIMIVRGQIVWSAANGTGNAQISLPFAAATGTGGAAGSARLQGVTFAAGVPTPIVTGGQSYFELSSPTTNAAEAITQVEAAGNIQFEIIYEV